MTPREIELLIQYAKVRGVFISWPFYGGGNAFRRCLVAHEEFEYNPDWNCWGPGYKSPIDIPRTSVGIPQKFDGATLTLQNVAHYATHINLANAWWDDTTLHRALTQAIREDVETNPQHRTYIQRVVDYKKILEVPVGHGPYQTSSILGFETCKWIQLYYENWKTIERRVPHKILDEKAARFAGFAEEMQEPNSSVLHVSIEQFFYSDFNTFNREWKRICEWVSIITPQTEAVRAFVLYYRDRQERFSETDRQLFERMTNEQTTER